MRGQTIFVVDDDPSISQILRKILKGEGYQVLEASTAKQAQELFAKNDIDLILMDMLLPDADGIELAQQMLAEKPHIPVILITAHASIPRAVEAIKLGLYDFLEKPFDRDRMLVTIRNALSWGEAQRELSHYRQNTLERFRMVGQSPAMQRVYDMIERVAPTESPVLITGENGVGKELVAQAIHNASSRAKKRMIKINCAAIPDTLLESELFGHTKGSFTGAQSAHPGRLQMADGSTLFLDEIGDLSPNAQAKVLRFLESGEVQRVGSTKTIEVNVRIIAATNQNLSALVQEGKFRQDLFYRLDVFPIHVPPLRERREDIPLLLNHFLNEYTSKNSEKRPRLTPSALRFLTQYEWPGNVRQLRHFVERLLILSASDLIELHHIKFLLSIQDEEPSPRESEDRTLRGARRHFEREHILTILAETEGNVSQAAKILGIDRANLYRKMEQLGIKG